MDITVDLDVDQLRDELEIDDVQSDLRALEDRLDSLEGEVEDLDASDYRDLDRRIAQIERTIHTIVNALKENI